MTLEIKTNGDAAYKRGYNEKELLVQALYDSLEEFQKNPNNGLYRFLFGKVYNNITACDRLGKRSKTLKVYPHRLSGQQVRYLKRAKKLAEELNIAFAEVVGCCSHVGHLASVVPATLIYLGQALREIDKLNDKEPHPDSHYRLEALRVHIDGIEDTYCH